MKTILTACIVVLGLFAQVCKAQWVELNPSINVSYFSDVYAISPDIVVVVGANGTIIKTTDGGQTWIQKTSGTTQNLQEIQFPTPEIGFVRGSNGTFLKTNNGGETWISIDAGFDDDFKYSCVNDNLIFATIGNSLLKSEDGGESWNNVSGENLIHTNKIQFLNDDIGLAGGYLWEGFSRTINGGETWENISLSVSPFYFFNDTTGFYYADGLYKSTDSGSSFSNLGGVGEWGGELRDIFSITENTVWGIIAGDLSGDNSTRGIIKMSISETEPYNEIIAWDNADIDMASIYFANENTGYVVGRNNGQGKIWKNSSGINDPLSTEEQQQLNFRVYPNPASSELNILMNNVIGEFSIIISDMTGKNIYSQTYSSIQKIKIDTNNLIQGTYILTIKNQNQKYSQKIIIH